MTLTGLPAAWRATMSAIEEQIDSSCTAPHLTPSGLSVQGLRRGFAPALAVERREAAQVVEPPALGDLGHRDAVPGRGVGEILADPLEPALPQVGHRGQAESVPEPQLD